MNKLKTFGCLFLAMLSCFTLGLYACTVKYGGTIEPHRWVMTSMFGLMFLVFFLSDYKKK